MNSAMTHQQFGQVWARISDSMYRNEISIYVPRWVRRGLHLQNVELLARGYNSSANPLEPEIEEAESTGDITFDEGDILLELDFLVSGDTAPGNQVYAVIESSCTVTVRDVLSAKRAAVLLRKLKVYRVEPLVVGNSISEEAAERACWDNVRFIRIEQSC